MLTTKQRKYLRALAHHLDPVVRIGQHGLTTGVAAETLRALASHELIKVKIDAEGAARKQLAGELAGTTQSEVVGLVGKIVMLYRERDEDPTIELPK
ncbi:MAG: ribosome assembly RNA-binding protein YhbY [Thermoanaerobaculia bacterium]|nr:ribosome assembly RNA-binding protein YhbY [Thermoanaerobaculia bacterium]